MTSLKEERTFVFFLQAEDGKRDLVRSSGLGEVYKGQGMDRVIVRRLGRRSIGFGTEPRELAASAPAEPVPYTHLTLPTILSA